ncbi:glycosyltransferase family 2 protein [Pedobacter sp. 22163]|uniref:glycosyltransferase family 2 protein n=1 Tax=Pedobacter sp. 22163 TaxID=3453883 RepID=UPI003F86EE4D
MAHELVGMLTIAIPTYNRPEALLKTLQAVILQLSPKVKVLVVDNASDVRLEEFVHDNINTNEFDIKFIRNKINVGADVNFIKCFEYTDTEFIWILGDDDELLDGAVDQVLDVIISNSHKSLIGINFQSNLCLEKRNEDICIDTIYGLANKLDYFSNLLFLSATVYNRSEYIKHLRFSAWGAYSMASQIVPLLISISQGRTLILAKAETVFNKPEPVKSKWSEIRLTLSLVALLEAPIALEKSTYRLIGKKIYSNSISMLTVFVCIINSINYDLHKIDNYHLYIFKLIFSKTFAFRSNKIYTFIEYILCLILLRITFLTKLLIRNSFLKRKIDNYTSFDLFVR